MPTTTAKHPGGRPTKYNDTMQQTAEDFFTHHMKLKNKVPYIEELALQLDVDDTTIINWATATDDNGDLSHPQFLATYKKIRTLAKLRLLQRTLFQFPAGSIFQLKANHGMMESDKRIIAGDKEEPLIIQFIDERPENTQKPDA